MGDIAAVGSWQKSSLLAVMAGSRGWQHRKSTQSDMHSGRAALLVAKNNKMKMKMALSDVSAATCTYSSRISTNIPLYEHPGVMYPTLHFLAFFSESEL